MNIYVFFVLFNNDGKNVPLSIHLYLPLLFSQFLPPISAMLWFWGCIWMAYSFFLVLVCNSWQSATTHFFIHPFSYCIRKRNRSWDCAFGLRCAFNCMHLFALSIHFEWTNEKWIDRLLALHMHRNVTSKLAQCRLHDCM